jgi:hypothetical protein
MTASQPALPTSAAPWQQRQVSSGIKVLLTLGMALLLIVATVTGIMTIGLLISVVGGLSAPSNSTASVRDLLIGVVLFGVSLFGLIKLFPLATAPTRFTPSYGVIPVETAGHLFEVQFQRNRWGRSLSKKGTVRFDADALQVEGYLTPNALFQIGIVLVVTLIPIVLLGIGLGIIPALIIAYYLGRKQIAQPIPYTQMRDLATKGCTVTFTNPGAVPARVSFYVATIDGERLYRELQARYPMQIVGIVRR